MSVEELILRSEARGRKPRVGRGRVQPWELLQDRQVLSESTCIPQALRVGMAAGTCLGGALAASVMMTVHMALDLAIPREVFVLDTHWCEMIFAQLFITTLFRRTQCQSSRDSLNRFWHILPGEDFTAIIYDDMKGAP